MSKHIHIHLEDAARRGGVQALNRRGRDAVKSINYSQLKEKFRNGEWDPVSDLRRNGSASYGTQEVLNMKTKERFTVQVEKIPPSKDAENFSKGETAYWDYGKNKRTVTIIGPSKDDPSTHLEISWNNARYNVPIKQLKRVRDAGNFAPGQKVRVPQLAKYLETPIMEVVRWNKNYPDVVYVRGKVKGGMESNEPNGMNSWKIPVNWISSTGDAGNFEESKHPRASNGEFGSGGGGGGVPKGSTGKQLEKHMEGEKAKGPAQEAALKSAGWKKASGKGIRGAEGMTAYEHPSKPGKILTTGGLWMYVEPGAQRASKQGSDPESLSKFLGTKDTQSVEAIFAALKRSDLLDDRREYDVDDLMKAYLISQPDAQRLYNMIQSLFIHNSKRV